MDESTMVIMDSPSLYNQKLNVKSAVRFDETIVTVTKNSSWDLKLKLNPDIEGFKPNGKLG